MSVVTAGCYKVIHNRNDKKKSKRGRKKKQRKEKRTLKGRQLREYKTRKEKRINKEERGMAKNGLSVS